MKAIPKGILKEDFMVFAIGASPGRAIGAAPFAAVEGDVFRFPGKSFSGTGTRSRMEEAL